MAKIVITGGAGFIGSHLSEALCQSGDNVTILDNLATGSLDNIAPLLENPRVTFIEGSITDLPLLQETFRDARYIFHLAALPSVPRSVRDPLASHNINATGTLNVLVAARDNGVRKVMYASSSSVYGDTPTLPKVETMPVSPLSPYAVSKLAGEQYCAAFRRVYGLDSACLRYFNVYGPRQNPDSQYAAVIPKFIRLMFDGESPVVYGDGEQTRDFTFVKDVVRANLLAAASDASGTYNTSRGEGITINRLVSLIASLTGSGVGPAYEAARPADIVHSLADSSRAASFGFHSEYSIEQGLAETVAWYRTQYLESNSPRENTGR